MVFVTEEQRRPGGMQRRSNAAGLSPPSPKIIMASRPHRRQVFLFLVAVLLPSVVLVALGLRMISQEQELAEQRVADDRRRAVTDIRDVLLAELDRIRLETVTENGGAKIDHRSAVSVA